MKKILFITHDTSRTGAPLVLLGFIKWLKRNHPEIEISLLALRGGELKDDFKKSVDQFIEKPKLSLGRRLGGKLYSLLNANGGITDFPSGIIERLGSLKFDMIYANTISSFPIGNLIKEKSKRSRLIGHVHEMETVINIMLPDLNNWLPGMDFFLSASEIVKKNLNIKYGVPNEKIRTVYEFASVSTEMRSRKKNEVFNVGGSGTVHWRKGSDLFLQVARQINSNYPELKVKFTWVGKVPAMEKKILEADIRKLGLEKSVHFTGLKKDPENYYKDFDIFLLTSREDPFPLVCIETGMMGIPIICFENATGTAEVLINGGGTIVPYLNIEKMAEKVAQYYEDPELIELHGKEGRELFAKFTPEKVCQEIFDVLIVTVKRGEFLT